MIIHLDRLLNDPKLQFQQDEEVDDYKVVIRKQIKKHQLYSELCNYGNCCYQGLKCNYAHRDDEKEYFREHPNMKNRALYKSKACTYGNICKYKTRVKMCPFVHEMTEVRCLSCKMIGSHWTDECPIPRDFDGIKKPGK